MLRAQGQLPCPSVCMSAVFEFADGRSRSKLLPGRRGKKRQDMFRTEPENGRRCQRAERSERISIWTFAAFSLTEPHWDRLPASRFLRHRSPALFSTKVA